MDTLDRSTADKVRALREGRGLYQRELAGRARVSAQTIRNVEAGRYATSPATLSRIARELGVSVTDLR